MTRDEFIVFLGKFSAQRFPEWLAPFYELLKCNSEEEAVSKLRKFRISESSYETGLEKFIANFPDQTEEIEYLNNVYTVYKQNYCLNKKEVKNNSNIYFETLMKILKSGYTMEEYCAVYGGYTLKELKYMVSNIKSTYPLLREEFQEKCMHSSEIFSIYIKKIIRIMSKIEDFTLFDYYYYTKLNPFDFIEICKKYLTKEELTIIQPVLSKLRRAGGTIYGTVSMHSDLDNITIIQGRQITKEEKEKIIEYLEADKIPSVAYKAALRKYVAGDERLIKYINNPQKIKK